MVIMPTSFAPIKFNKLASLSYSRSINNLRNQQIHRKSVPAKYTKGTADTIPNLVNDFAESH